MKPEEQIKALAELDGKWSTQFPYQPEGHQAFEQMKYLPHYLTSYDAIISLIGRQSREIRETVDQEHELVGFGYGFPTPAQLCKALLLATKKWKK